jgi:hypothetical protein
MQSRRHELVDDRTKDGSFRGDRLASEVFTALNVAAAGRRVGGSTDSLLEFHNVESLGEHDDNDDDPAACHDPNDRPPSALPPPITDSGEAGENMPPIEAVVVDPGGVVVDLGMLSVSDRMSVEVRVDASASPPTITTQSPTPLGGHGPERAGVLLTAFAVILVGALSHGVASQCARWNQVIPPLSPTDGLRELNSD